MAEKKMILPMAVRPMEKESTKESYAPCSLYAHLGGMLEEWKNHRRAVIEDVWDTAYKNYNGVFDEDEVKSRSTKSWRSKAFYPLTEQKVTSAQAQLQDVLFKGGKFPYDIKCSPLPDDPSILAANQAVSDGAMGNGMLAVTEQKAIDKQELEARIKNMKKRIDDQFAECDAASVGLTSIYDGALYGTAFLESPKVIRKKRHK